MSLASVVSMLLIVGTIVGGFIYFLTVAMKKEKEKDF